MPIGFMQRYCSALVLALAAPGAQAIDLQLVGSFGEKAAILSIDGRPPRTVRVGESIGGATLISVDRERAVIEVEGRRVTLPRGQAWRSGTGADVPQLAVLAADARGHYMVEGQVNGGSMRFVLDTGATLVALPAADALRLGIDFRNQPRALMHTANGVALAYSVRLRSVRIGTIELNDIDGVVLEQGLGVGLLGMSFLNRVDMRRDGVALTLTRRF